MDLTTSWSNSTTEGVPRPNQAIMRRRELMFVKFKGVVDEIEGYNYYSNSSSVVNLISQDYVILFLIIVVI